MTQLEFPEEQKPVITIEPVGKITMLSAIETILDMVEDLSMRDIKKRPSIKKILVSNLFKQLNIII